MKTLAALSLLVILQPLIAHAIEPSLAPLPQTLQQNQQNLAAAAANQYSNSVTSLLAPLPVLPPGIAPKMELPQTGLTGNFENAKLVVVLAELEGVLQKSSNATAQTALIDKLIAQKQTLASVMGSNLAQQQAFQSQATAAVLSAINQIMAASAALPSSMGTDKLAKAQGAAIDQVTKSLQAEPPSANSQALLKVTQLLSQSLNLQLAPNKIQALQAAAHLPPPPVAAQPSLQAALQQEAQQISDPARNLILSGGTTLNPISYPAHPLTMQVNTINVNRVIQNPPSPPSHPPGD